MTQNTRFTYTSSVAKALAAVATLALAGCAAPPHASQTASPAASQTASRAASQAASPPAPAVATEVKSLLWVGNSFFYFNNSMHGHVGQLLSAAGRSGMRSTSATISGSGINWHDVEAHFKPGGVGSYSFAADNAVRFNTFDKPFDAVLMMDCSQCPVHPQLQAVFHEYVAKHSATVRKYGAAPILFMSWAYQDVPAMTETLAAEYIKAGKANHALVVPAGLAFANSIAKRPDVNLYMADKRHPSLAGTYLGACTVLASVYKTNPVGLKYTAELPADVAAHLQAVAWETAQAFQANFQGAGQRPAP